MFFVKGRAEGGGSAEVGWGVKGGRRVGKEWLSGR